jgi:hypothetical protein
MLAGLHFQLYREGYCLRFNGGAAPEPGIRRPDTAFRQALAAANPGRTRLDPGWQVVGPGPGDTVWLRKGALGRQVRPGTYLTHDGPQASLYWPHESWALQPGNYFVFGATVSDSVADARTMRFYWHIQAQGAPQLVATLARTLDRFQVPFRLKCPDHPGGYARRDACVLYTSRRDYRLVAQLVTRVYEQVQADMDPDTPLFTRRLAPGLALADDPGADESFGQHRCRLLAEALWLAHEQGIPQRQVICDHFARAGLDLDRPYLHPGGGDDYPWPP